ncbi:protein phosphatase 1 regulatory subunit 12C isoform X7 [Ctenocephalides felis]|uniref:protein phosphatase 1 regulatory subunit 12C isoform X5 n=1 Tax=Ctenocephalides felis TaxID=7515 RepID=UPI000E6E2324|nr:protein phosphatase 1 regulatory subunit 12C isoform X5 [Ctenocephalides felis]XP_026471378.1 protein phosphatase 1 regulatory subunit 12C isoform X6 [Ctenocephalides felis]XP_026471379.1 protein phosphatase 1 regulatory subunit 12C isoform X7 [Ctenocephalides felis]
MSLEARSSSALFKRAEQLKRWEESETNREPPVPKHNSRRIKFSSGCVFLAACAAGDKDEVLKMLDQGADIDTANVDGLTALHQACIDDNLDMVEFLVSHGADVNRGDNEAWTPLHATASCGFVSIARYLLEHDADSSLVNSDGELALDIGESDAMRSLLRADAERRGVDVAAARAREERVMLEDAKRWLRTGECGDRPHPRTGATALHVAAAKGYTKVLGLLLPGWPDINCQDNDGWTPLHAAAHWCQKQAALSLVDALADMDTKNYVGQTCFDVADIDMKDYLEELRGKQMLNNRDLLLRKKQAQAAKRRPPAANNQQQNNAANVQSPTQAETPNKLIKVEIENSASTTDDNMIEMKNKVITPPSSPKIEQKIDDNSVQFRRPNTLQTTNQFEKENTSRTINAQKEENSTTTEKDSDVVLRRTQSFEADDKFYRRYMELHARIKASSCPSIPSPVGAAVTPTATSQSCADVTAAAAGNNININSSSRVTVGGKATQAAAQAVANATTGPVQRSASLRDHRVLRRAAIEAAIAASTAAAANTQRHTISTTTPSIRRSFVPPVRDEESETQRKAHAKRVRETRRSTQGVTLDEIKSAEQLVKQKNHNNNSIGNHAEDSTTLTKPQEPSQPIDTEATHANALPGSNHNHQSPASPTTNSITVSFTTRMPNSSATTNVEPANGSDLKHQENNGIVNNGGLTSRNNGNGSTTAASATITPAGVGSRGSESPVGHHNHERRPSWRLKVDNGSKFKLEDATKSSSDTQPTRRPTSVPAVNNSTSSLSRDSAGNNNRSSVADPTRMTNDATVTGTGTGTDNTTVTLQLRRPTRSTQEDKEQDKENDVRNAQATQAVIQRRRRPKRRSTGVVNLDMDDLDPDKQDGDNGAGGDNNTNESGSERSSRSRLGSSTSLVDDNDVTENGSDVIDYKALWESAKADNERLQEQLKKRNEELKDAKATIDRVTNVTNKGALSELEKREKRAMERKLSEMEEELKQLQKLKHENERLRAENRALTRVVSKLTANANK